MNSPPGQLELKGEITHSIKGNQVIMATNMSNDPQITTPHSVSEQMRGMEKRDASGTDTTSVWPDWLNGLRSQGMNLYYSTSGHAWIRFHKWAYTRFPPHDVSPVSKAEEREMFFKLKAPVISHHHEIGPGETANALLYICRDHEYDVSKLSPNNRSKVRRGLKRMDVRKATAQQIAERGYACYYDTSRRNGIAPISEDKFQAKWRKDKANPFREIWAAFAGEDIAAIGIVLLCGRWAELFSTQSANKYLKDYSNHALFYSILQDLMHREGIESVSYGLSSVQPNSKLDSLHHFKLSVNLDPVPVVRQIRINPLLRITVNLATLTGARGLERWFPNSRQIRTARGALELMVNGDEAVLPSDHNSSTRPIELGDARAVAEIHRQVFPKYPSTKLGRSFCTELYRAYAKAEDAFGFISWRGGKRVGFVVGGSFDIHEQVNRTLRGKALKAMAMRPRLLLRMAVHKMSGMLIETHSKTTSPTKRTDDKSRIAKLVLIGVKETARGTGVAAELIQAFREEAARRGYNKVMLIVSRDNARARTAYEKAGWTLIDNGGEAVKYQTTAF